MQRWLKLVCQSRFSKSRDSRRSGFRSIQSMDGCGRGVITVWRTAETNVKLWSLPATRYCARPTV